MSEKISKKTRKQINMNFKSFEKDEVSFKQQMVIGVVFWIAAIIINYLIDGGFNNHINNITPVTIIFAGLWFIPRFFENKSKS